MRIALVTVLLFAMLGISSAWIWSSNKDKAPAKAAHAVHKRQAENDTDGNVTDDAVNDDDDGDDDDEAEEDDDEDDEVVTGVEPDEDPATVP
ncbi:uncharacterized protein [Macrobrachium rosenbergii]|uniref:uncharacterized protein n=1 Tax=Macrobrachium rosenbergii TaxID=79674 RepID=UPI0034D5F61A